MGFKQLLTKVQQAEAALEARERRVGAEWQRLKVTWKEGWTPGRVIIAGLVSGFVVGRAAPVRAAARSGQIMQLVTMLSGLFAGGSAQVAATEAEHAADTAEGVADAVAPQAGSTQSGAVPSGAVPSGAARAPAAQTPSSQAPSQAAAAQDFPPSEP
ncbi:hypothetical protein J2X04_002218 [Lysobacter niabensis]|jgi:hypothetical protein|uniref:Protein sip-5 n=1 Tax=Agrilutibacter niabensis TaxID=380628 RepID=A0ABU1VQS7_9GAMM|nr:hypothetical protein [Lysobacter niabensis]MDR7099837.1 hypothetical protein [Lysobacter niabensis]